MTLKTLWWFCVVSLPTTTLALECESYDLNCQTSDPNAPGNSSCYSLHQCDHIPGMTPACYALLVQNKEGLGASVVMKGCMQKRSHDCWSASVCSGHAQERNSRKRRPSQYYCCCTEDRCNRHVVLFVSEEKEESGIEESIRKLTLLIWAQFVTVAIFSSFIAIAYTIYKVKSVRRRTPLSPAVCNKGAHRSQNTSHWTRKDFNLITCLVRSKFGEVWQARPRGSNQVVRIRLSAGSDDVYIYDSHLMAKDKNVHTIRNV